MAIAINAIIEAFSPPGTPTDSGYERLHVLKIYSALGKSSDDGHNLIYLAIPEWEPDVFQFLDANVKR